MNEEIVAHFLEIERIEVDENELSSFKSESDFVGKSVDLLIEAGSFVIVAASVYPSGEEGWTRNEAIIGGSLVRLYKLIDAILDQTCKHRLEMAFILGRLHFETVVNSLYLMEHPLYENFEKFVIYSLQHEEKRISDITKRIKQREGLMMPIEERMINSINRMFDISGIEISDMPRKKLRDWAGSNLRQRAIELGLESPYFAVFSGGSLIVHGNWGDLYYHHLEFNNGRFRAKTEFNEPRPQYLEVNALFSVKVVSRFIEFLGLFRERRALQQIFDDFEDRLSKLSRAHELFLQRPGD